MSGPSPRARKHARDDAVDAAPPGTTLDARGEAHRGLVRDAAWVAGLVLTCVLAYLPSLGGGFLWDDPAHVTRAGLRSVAGLGRIWFEPGATQEFYPVLHSAFWIQYQLWGDAALPYRILNVMLHAGNSCLLALLLRRLARLEPSHPPAEVESYPAGAAWLAGLLFAVHPVCVESVAWITEQKNTLSTLFYLLAVLLYLRHREKPRFASALWAWTLFFLALGTKTMTVTLPAALLVLTWWRTGRLRWRHDVVPLLPWLATALAAGVITIHIEGSIIGADIVADPLSPVQRALLAARIFWFSLGKTLWPTELTFFYERWDVARDSGSWVPHLVAFLAATALLWMLRRRCRGPLAAWLLYAGTLFPVLGFFNIFSFSFAYVADHYHYLAIPVVMAAVSAGLQHGLARIRRPARVALFASAAVLGAMTWRSSRHYTDDETLFRANIASNPRSWYGHHVLAGTLARSHPGDLREPIALYRRALELKQDNPDSLYMLGLLLVRSPQTHAEGLKCYRRALALRPSFAEAHNSLAVELAQSAAHIDDAVIHYREAVRLRPRFAIAHANLGRALMQIPGRDAEAAQHFEEALRLQPDHAMAHFFLGRLLLGTGRGGEAIAHLEAAMRAEPDSAEAHAWLAHALAQHSDRISEADRHFARAIRLEPRSATFHALQAGALMTRPGRAREAAALFDRAVQLDPNQAWIRVNFARLLAAQSGEEDRAWEHAYAAVRLEPGNAEAHNLLGILHAKAGRTEAARASWEEALRIDPGFTPARRNLDRHGAP